MKKIQKRRNLKLYTSLLVVIIIICGFFLWLDKAYDRLEADYLARNPNPTYPEQIREDFLKIINDVRYFKHAQSTLYVRGGFERWFSIAGYKDNVGPNLRFNPADGCITFDTYFSEQDVIDMLDDLYRIGFTPDRYSPSIDIIIKDLSGEKTKPKEEIAPSHSFDRGDRRLRIITPFRESNRITTGFACLSEN